MHTPVLLAEVIQWLQVQPDEKYIDATVGEGGHTKAILELGGIVLGIDRDKNQIESFLSNLSGFKNRIFLRQGNFSDIDKIAKDAGFDQVGGVLFDLGVSMGQLRGSVPGLSYQNDSDQLDMRLDNTLDKTAANILNQYDKRNLYQTIAGYGEELKASVIIEKILQTRIKNKIKTVGDLNKILKKTNGGEKTQRRVFQALRIAVNHEFDNLHIALEKTLKLLKPGGKILVISFHSNEDRIVKQFIVKNRLKQLHKKLIVADRLAYFFERSARLRVFSNNPT